MAQLPIQQLTLWKQGFGYFERRGRISEREISLIVPRAASNDVLKSLNVVVYEGGQVISVDYETPEDKHKVLADLPVKLADRSSLLDLLVSLRGSRVTLMLENGTAVNGRLVGVESSVTDDASVIVQSIDDAHDIAFYSINTLTGVKLLDDRASNDVSFFLDVSQVEQNRSTLTVRVSEGEHEIGLSYLAPGPVWRMSYRLNRIDDGKAILTAWGIFENSLDEDLHEVSLTLISGRPISFVYDLYESQTPERPKVSDATVNMAKLSGDPRIQEAFASISHELRTPMNSVIGFSQFLLEMDHENLTKTQIESLQNINNSGKHMLEMLNNLLSLIKVSDGTGRSSNNLAWTYRSGPLGDLKVSGQYFVPVMMSNAETEYLTYRVDTPITVRRGQSAMVPIINTEVAYRSLVVFNGDKMPNHPLQVWELDNTTGYALEQGPITIIDESYAGEGLMRFAGVGDNIQIPYALEFGILVTEDVERSDVVLFAVEIDTERRKALLRQSQITIHQYTLSSRVEHDITVLIERHDPTRDSYHEMPEPVFEAAGHTRWAVDVAGNSSVTFPVQIRSITSQTTDATTWKADYIESLNEQGFLSNRLYTLLQALLTVKDDMQDAVQEMSALQKEQGRIQTLQEQFRKNLGALGNSEREASIRNQTLTDLENSENRRRTIEARLLELEQQMAEMQVRQTALTDEIYAAVS